MTLKNEIRVIVLGFIKSTGSSLTVEIKEFLQNGGIFVRRKKGKAYLMCMDGNVYTLLNFSASEEYLLRKLGYTKTNWRESWILYDDEVAQTAIIKKEEGDMT